MPITEVGEEISKDIEVMRDEIISLLVDLVRSNSVNPPGDTREVADVVIRKLAANDIEAQIIVLEEKKPNVLARINPEKRPELLFNSHLDTVPIGERIQWRHDPLGAKIVEGVMYGRGAADAKASVAAMTMAAVAIARKNLDLRGTLILKFVSDEETGGWGTKYILDEDYVDPDFVVIGEQTDNRIAIAEKGVIWLNIKTKGRAAHASIPWFGVSAIDNMLKLLNQIEEKITTKIKTQIHPLTPPPSINIGTIRGGIKTNVVADACEVTIDRRFLPHENPDSIVREFLDIVEELRGSNSDFDAEVQTPLIASPVDTSPEEEIVKIAKETLRSLDLKEKLVGYMQASDGRFYSERKIPTIILGPSDPKVGHTSNEHVVVDDVIIATKIYALLALYALG